MGDLGRGAIVAAQQAHRGIHCGGLDRADGLYALFIAEAQARQHAFAGGLFSIHLPEKVHQLYKVAIERIEHALD